MANFKVLTVYEDGTRRTLETTDGAIAVREAGNASYEEEKAKTVSLEQDGTVIYSDKIKAWKVNGNVQST